MSFLIIGTITHALIGALLAWLMPTDWSPVYAALVFFAKEYGELRQKLPGSIKTVSKNLAILKELFTNPKVLMQWVVAGIGALVVNLV